MTYATYRAAGRCGRCGCGMADDWCGAYCPSCKDDRALMFRTAHAPRARRRARARNAERVAKSLCIQCLAPSAPGHIRCTACMDRAKACEVARRDRLDDETGAA